MCRTFIIILRLLNVTCSSIFCVNIVMILTWKTIESLVVLGADSGSGRGRYGGGAGKGVGVMEILRQLSVAVILDTLAMVGVTCSSVFPSIIYWIN